MSSRILLEDGTSYLLLANGTDFLRREETFFDEIRQNIINGLVSDHAEATGWNAAVQATLSVTAVVRTSNTVVTITLPAEATYDIAATETVTVTLPAVSVVSSQAVRATPGLTVLAVGTTQTIAAHRPAPFRPGSSTLRGF